MSQAGRESRRKEALRGAVIGLAMTSAIGIATWGETPLAEGIERLELALYDLRLKNFANPEAVSDRVTIVKIDDTTIRNWELAGNSWPPERWFYGELVASLRELKPAAIVFDYVFSDLRDSARYGSAGDPFAEPKTEGGARAFESTREAARNMHGAGNVVFGYYAMNLEGTADEVRVSTGFNEKLTPYFDRRIAPVAGAERAPPFRIRKAKEFTIALQYPEGNMLVGARALGLVNHEHVTDVDGVSRRFQPVVRVGGKAAPDLGTTALVVALAGSAQLPEWSFTAPPPAEAWPPLPPIRYEPGAVHVGKYRIPVDSGGEAQIRWRGHWEREDALKARTYNAWDLYLHAEDILLGNPVEGLDRSLFEGNIVFVGFTGQGEGSDNVSTPFGSQPGVYHHASLVDTVLVGDYPQQPPGLFDWSIAAILACATGGYILAYKRSSNALADSLVLQVAKLVALGLVPMAAFGAVAWGLFALPHSRDLELMPSWLAMFFTVAMTVPMKVLGAERKAMKMATRAFGPKLVRKTLASGGKLETGGVRVPLTLYFSDIQGFTTISEKLSPEELITMLNEYLTRVTEVLEKGHHGNVDKYIGDAVMCFWGAPDPDPQAAVHACEAAIDVIKEIDRFSQELIARGLTPLRTRIGINTGLAVAGGVGHVRDDEGKYSYTALGDTVNLASRLEGANKAYGTTCMLGPETYEQAKHVILARELDLVRVKGKTIPVRVYELLGRVTDPLPEKRRIKERYEAALQLFRAREFEKARSEFQALLTEFGDTPSKTLLACCEENLRNPPPPDWDGSNELHEK